ncbi:hypothetical protein CFC21_002559, partial [Triticum aestivum]
TAAAAAALR